MVKIVRMAYHYEVEEVPPDDVPSVEHDLRRAKMFLQKHSPESGDSLYDHLTELLSKILSEQPRNAVDIFEEISRKVKQEKFKTADNHLRDLYVPSVQYNEAKNLIKLYKDVQRIYVDEPVKLDEGDEEEEEDKRRKKPNMLDMLFYFEQVDVGLPRSEMVSLNMSIWKLMAEHPIQNVRFWGKILGNPKNYYVVEADLQAEELHRRLEKIAEQEERKRQEEQAKAEEAQRAAEETAETVARGAEEETEEAKATEEKEEEGLKLVFPPLPTRSWKPPPEVPSERIGSGVNAKVYFVCNEPGLDKWVELPSVTPQQIVIARQIVRYCTGNLETPLYTFPPFPGKEKNYLRAQIARISGSTLVSPIGFYTFGGEDEEEELGEEPAEGEGLSENAHYYPRSAKDLIDPTMSHWCHHSQYILKQGRTVWWDPRREDEQEGMEGEEEVDEEEEQETEEGAAIVQREVGPPLLTPLSEDAVVDSITPWTGTQSSQILPELAVALIRSNIWPGAFAFACGRRVANLYVGWAHKYVAYNYSPPWMPMVQDQYAVGPEIMEIRDPTFEEEEAYRISKLPPPPPLQMDEEEEAVDVEEEEEEDDEDDD